MLSNLSWVENAKRQAGVTGRSRSQPTEVICGPLGMSLARYSKACRQATGTVWQAVC